MSEIGKSFNFLSDPQFLYSFASDVISEKPDWRRTITIRWMISCLKAGTKTMEPILSGENIRHIWHMV